MLNFIVLCFFYYYSLYYLQFKLPIKVSSLSYIPVAISYTSTTKKYSFYFHQFSLSALNPEWYGQKHRLLSSSYSYNYFFCIATQVVEYFILYSYTHHSSYRLFPNFPLFPSNSGTCLEYHILSKFPKLFPHNSNKPK